jgi:hypothetical protein
MFLQSYETYKVKKKIIKDQKCRIKIVFREKFHKKIVQVLKLSG